jgi:Zn-dependent protease with chaperone function
MDFFEKQENARRRTHWLVVYFALAVLGIILALHVGFSFLLGEPVNDPALFLITALGVLISVAIGSLVKIIQLSKGGKAVAELLGGTPVSPATTDPAERRLRNVVEEMSLASGVPVPALYILDEPGINAFAAGYGPTDAAIGVTRGCLGLLSRDELQGVIGHEFSHILNGDMRLNIRLMGLLNGILFLAVLGGILLRVAASTRPSRQSRDKNGNSIVAVLFAAGILFYIVGWIGVFFAKLIKAAVSREREFLADASAVQYTRNPDGIAGALAKIGAHSSQLAHPRAQEASHMFFGNGLADSWLQLFATHPPLDERIRRISPGFELANKKNPPPLPSTSPVAPGTSRLAVGASLLSALPAASIDASHELLGSCALVFSLLLPKEKEARSRELETIDPAFREATKDLFKRSGPLSSARKIALVDLAIPALRQLSPPQYAAFRSTVQHLVEADGQIHLFEYTLQKLLFRHLDTTFKNARPPRVQFRSITPLLPEIGLLLSAISNADAEDLEAGEAAFQEGLRALGTQAAGFPLARHSTVNLADFDKALDHLATASPAIKKTILTACGAAVMADGSLNDAQFELLRAAADTIDCPIPPFVKTE